MLFLEGFCNTHTGNLTLSMLSCHIVMSFFQVMFAIMFKGHVVRSCCQVMLLGHVVRSLCCVMLLCHVIVSCCRVMLSCHIVVSICHVIMSSCHNIIMS